MPSKKYHPMKRDDFNAYIRESNYNGMFVELGWNHVNSSDRINPIEIEETAYEIVPVADKQGFKALICHTEELPQHSVRKKIDFQLRKYFHNYVLIFIKNHSEHQMWMVPIKRIEKRDLVIVEYPSADTADFLYSKVPNFRFGLEEEVTIVDVTLRVHGAFELNSERVTKDFYAGFRKQHNSFVKFIEGIDVEGDRQWYASVMLNRLMFCYFIQKKGFLNFDVDYLRNKLIWTKEQQGEDQFFGTFYKGFLTHLFHGGLNEPKHNREFKTKYGRIPYLNGGLFDKHQLEQDYSDIDIPDQAFEDLFNFFDKWRWHLDTRIEATGRDINPDVLGYIFEQYINDRAQMGAYYTKEDITEYISKNCILPFLMDEVSKSPSKKHFTPGGMVWETLRNSGDTYIYDAVKKGTEIKEIPEEIAVGLDTSKPDLLDRRKYWNTPTPEAYALPTEIWRETIERRNRYNELLGKIRNGEITQINDFITYNLDIRRFVEDLLAQTNDHLFILHFYKALQNVTILDPTCGSGAFLFAALNILEPLYEICIIRMQEFNAKNNLLFKEQLDEIEHKYRSNIQYFIYKSIILRNLYGVDIMHEATEIARLRLFLKMVAVVDVNPRADNLGLDPLPDIDFNIRCGNTLIGYATQAELEKDLVEGDMFANMEFREKIEEEMQKVAMAYQTFKEIQLTQHDDMESFKHAKTELNNRLAKLNDTLNKRLYASTATETTLKYEDWLSSHQLFHWIAEFYEIIQGKGGFDVIIGNPPYVEYNKKNTSTKKSIADIYTIDNFKTIDCGNLYAFILERTKHLVKETSFIGMIVPLSGHSTERMTSLVTHFYNAFSLRYLCNLSADAHPSMLFEGVKFRLSIFIVNNTYSGYFTSKYTKWYADEREYLFTNIVKYNQQQGYKYKNVIGKVSGHLYISAIQKVLKDTSFFFCHNGVFVCLYHNAPVHWIRSHSFKPYFHSERDGEGLSTQLKPIKFDSNEKVKIASCVLNSNLFFTWWICNSDCYHLNKAEIANFPITFNTELKLELVKLSDLLAEDMLKNSVRRIYNYKTSGRVEYDEFYMKLSKPIIDEIDKVLAKHYGFTEEELDFIINYDIKYRMGNELNAEEE